MDIPAQAMPHPYVGWPGNELEEVLAAALGAQWTPPDPSGAAGPAGAPGPSGVGFAGPAAPDGHAGPAGAPAAGARILEVLSRSPLWVPLPSGGSPGQPVLDLPTIELQGQAYVPVFSSEQQFRYVAGDHMSCTVAPAVEFARGLPPQMGIAVNPEGTVGIPLPPPAVAELCRAGRTPLDGASGGRVRLFEPDWKDDPLDFLAAAAEEFAGAGAGTVGAGAFGAPAAGAVRTARRCLASIEGDDPVLFVGVELAPQAEAWAASGDAREAPLAALGRALGRVPVRWPVNLVLLDVTQDLVADWMRQKVAPFYTAAR